jgi:ubiquitin-conjugating enzyme E2 F
MEQHLPAGCRVKFEDPNALHDFVLAVCPEEGFWQGGKFKFHIKVINIDKASATVNL